MELICIILFEAIRPLRSCTCFSGCFTINSGPLYPIHHCVDSHISGTILTINGSNEAVSQSLVITLPTLPVPEIDLSLILKLLETYQSFQDDTDIEAQMEPASVNIID